IEISVLMALERLEAGYPRTGDDDVETAEAFDDLFDDPGVDALLSDVGDDVDIAGHVGRHDLGAVGGEAQRGRASDPRSRSGDKGPAARKTCFVAHSELPPSMRNSAPVAKLDSSEA